MSSVLLTAIDKASRKREYMIQQAKTKGPSAAFYVGLVAISQAIDHAKTVPVVGEGTLTAYIKLRDVSADIDLRYQSERDGR